MSPFGFSVIRFLSSDIRSACSLETKQRTSVPWARIPCFLRKEVIQPQVPLRLPCYDFTPITDHTLVRCPPEGLAHALLVQPTFVV
jgi:hypothetical protein